MLPVARDVVIAIHVEKVPVLHRGNVGARRERLFASSEDHRADRLVAIEGLERRAQLLHQLRVQRIELLRAIQRNERNAPFYFRVDEFVRHGSFLAFSSDSGIAPGISIRRRPGSTSSSASTSRMVRALRTASWR
ncbi:hypothetical protein D3C83_27690 [compost metagenome]